jgi:hypothetical protein
MIRLLLDHGADPMLKSHVSGLSPIQCAKKKSLTDTIGILQDYMPKRRFTLPKLNFFGY